MPPSARGCRIAAVVARPHFLKLSSCFFTYWGAPRLYYFSRHARRRLFRCSAHFIERGGRGGGWHSVQKSRENPKKKVPCYLFFIGMRPPPRGDAPQPISSILYARFVPTAHNRLMAVAACTDFFWVFSGFFPVYRKKEKNQFLDVLRQNFPRLIFFFIFYFFFF